MEQPESLREQSLEWFFSKSTQEKQELKEKHFPNTYIARCSHWGYHFNFGQIETMFISENNKS